ncbi:MAG: DEAD/DEAH box helicase family protein [Clostridia bacterium]|nr:DEAD/DEAH box helicase family protein [Clostridia bacterium]
MLQEAKDLQINAVTELYNQLKEKDEITFKAPTGSGKTYMMADLMNRVLENNNDVVFLVSTLSKGNLSGQNYDKFYEYSSSGLFVNLKPYLISSEVSSEERLFIPTDYNVYILPRDLYKKGGKLMQGAMESFLQNMTLYSAFGGLNKDVYLIKDECHIATNNLDNLSKTYFSKALNFSATPNLRRGQNPDVEIKDEDAVNAKLIKYVEFGEDTDTVADAICKFEEIKESYRNLLGVNPCLIIQISNKEKADYELHNVIFPELSKAEHQDLKWMLIVDKDKDCDTNDTFKAKKLPVSKWKDYAKQNTATVDIIIFKMVISEGWDIPRACMLYQVRDSQSQQLDEQVMGRVRRNPRLLDFETLSVEAQKLATTAWIWGVIPEKQKKVFGVRLWDEPEDITEEFKLNITKLKTLEKKPGFDIDSFLGTQPTISAHSSIFDLYRKIEKSNNEVRQMCYTYADSISKWWSFAEHIDAISAESNKYICDYGTSMEIVTDDNDIALEVSFPYSSSYVDNGNYVNIGDWIWRRRDAKDRFSFDSEAEREWASIIKDLATSDTNEIDPKRVAKRVPTGKKNPQAGQINLFGETEPKKLNVANKYLWGKNYIPNSNIKFEYCLGGIHSSYPDFIMKDSFGRIHIFEVKSVNTSSSTSSSFDSESYKKKVEELKRCYKQASLLTGYIFYLPIMKGDEWQITRLFNGLEQNLTQSQFEEFVRTKPKKETV